MPSVTRLADACGHFSVRYRVPLVLVSTILVLASLWPAFRVPFNASAELWFLNTDPALSAYQDFHDLFGDDEFIVLATEVESGNVFTNEILESVERVSTFLESQEALGQVISLARYESIHGEADEITLIPAVPHLPMTDLELETMSTRILADSLALKRVVTPDGTIAVIMAELEFRVSEFKYRLAIAEDVREFLEKEHVEHGIEYKLTGSAIMDADIYRDTRSDLFINTALVYLLVGVFLAYTIRNVAGTLFPLALVFGTVLLNRTFFHFLHWEENSLATIVPLVLTAVGIADSVHIVVQFFEIRGQGTDARESARETVRRMFKPCLLTSITTAVGFLSLLTAPLAPLQEMGVLTGIGVGIAFLLSVTVLPAALSFLPGDYAGYTRRRAGSPLVRFIHWVPGFVGRRPGPILALGALVSIVAGVGFFRLEVESNAIDFFRKDDPIRVVSEYIQDNVGGVGTLEVVVTAQEEGGIRDPELLRAMDDLDSWLTSRPLITDAYSVVEYLKEINRAMNDGDPERYRVPQSSDLTAQYLLLYGASSPASGLESLIDITQTQARVGSRVRFAGSSEYREEIKELRRFLDTRMPEGVRAEPTGLMMLYKNMGDYIVTSQVRSFLAALVVITLTMGIAFRSWRIGLLSMIPNVWPIAFTLGLMGWIGARLDMVNAMVAAIAIGIAVDDTVHFLSRFIEARRAGQDPQTAIAGAFRVSGKAIVYTTVILLAGFGVIMRSQFLPTATFALLCCSSILMALVADFFILPALLILLSRDRVARRSGVKVAAMSLLVVVGLAWGDPAVAQDEAAAERGRAVLLRVEEANADIRSEEAEVAMILRDRGGRSVTRDVRMAFLDPEGSETRSLIRFNSPPDVRGTAFLTHQKEGDDDQWLYLPALDRVKRIAANKRSGNFVGTEFTYEDLGGRRVADYTHRFLREESLDGETVDVVESRPTSSHSGYSRIVSWVSRERAVLMKAEYYDRKERHLKTSRSEGFHQPDGQHWRFRTATMENHLNGKSTTLEVAKWSLDAELDSSEFTVEALDGAW